MTPPPSSGRAAGHSATAFSNMAATSPCSCPPHSCLRPESARTIEGNSPFQVKGVGHKGAARKVQASLSTLSSGAESHQNGISTCGAEGHHSASGRNGSTQGGSGIGRMAHGRLYRAPVRTTAQRSSHVRRIPPEQSESDAMQHSELMAGLCCSSSQPAACSLRCPPGPSAGSTVTARCPALNDRLKMCTTSPWEPGPWPASRWGRDSRRETEGKQPSKCDCTTSANECEW
jgi:hypothetical protein